MVICYVFQIVCIYIGWLLNRQLIKRDKPFQSVGFINFCFHSITVTLWFLKKSVSSVFYCVFNYLHKCLVFMSFWKTDINMQKPPLNQHSLKAYFCLILIQRYQISSVWCMTDEYFYVHLLLSLLWNFKNMQSINLLPMWLKNYVVHFFKSSNWIHLYWLHY